MIRSPIKWAGGKARVMPQLLKHLPKADCLIEPFAGSGTVFMNTDYRSYILCDSNASLINFFIVLRDETEQLIGTVKHLFNGGNNAEYYYQQRATFNSLRRDEYAAYESCSRHHAALFLYLNRHCFNGLFRVNKNGDFNVPFGTFADPYLPETEMRLFAEKAHDTNTRFLFGDFRYTIPFTAKRPDSAFYCDPPYIPASETANFTAYGEPFSLSDHRDLVSVLTAVNRQHGTRSVISNSDTPETHAIYSPAFALHSFSVRRSVSAKSRDMAGEVIGVLIDRARYTLATPSEASTIGDQADAN